MLPTIALGHLDENCILKFHQNDPSSALAASIRMRKWNSYNTKVSRVSSMKHSTDLHGYGRCSRNFVDCEAQIVKMSYKGLKDWVGVISHVISASDSSGMR